MTTFDMNNATNIALKMDIYAIYLRKSRADLEAEELGEGETYTNECGLLFGVCAHHVGVSFIAP